MAVGQQLSEKSNVMGCRKKFKNLNQELFPYSSHLTGTRLPNHLT